MPRRRGHEECPPAVRAASGPTIVRRASLGLFLLCSGLFLASTSGTFMHNQDAVFMWGVARGMSRGDGVSVAPEAVTLLGGGYQHLKGVDGRYYFPKGMSYSALLVPFCWAGEAVASAIGVVEPLLRSAVSMAVCSTADPLLAALEVLLIFHLCRFAGMGPRLSAAGAAGAALGTILWADAKSTMSEPLLGLLITAQFYCLMRYQRDPSPRWLAWAGSALSLTFLAQPALLAPLAPTLGGLAAWIAWHTHRARLAELLRAAVALGLPVAVGLCLLGYLNLVRYGSPLSTGYWNFVVSRTPLFEGAYGVLLSPGKSIFLYSPPLLLLAAGLRFWRRQAGVAALFPLLSFLGFFALYGWLPIWHGDGAWGPRYFVPLTGGLVALAAGALAGAADARALTRRARLWMAAVLVGAAVQIIGVVTSTPSYFALLIENKVVLGSPGDAAWKPILFSPHLSPVVGRARLVTSRARAILTGEHGSWTVRRADGQRVTLALEKYDSVDLWPARLAAGFGRDLRPPLVACWLGLLVTAAVGGRMTWRAVRLEPSTVLEQTPKSPSPLAPVTASARPTRP